jgi:hypothetical protein
MSSKLIQLADAIVTDLQGAAFDLSLQAERGYQVIKDLPELDHVTVLVVPRSVEIQTATRATRQYDPVIDVGVLRKLPTFISKDKDLETLDGLMGLVEQMVVFLFENPLPTGSGHHLIEVNNNPIYRPEHLAGSRQFTSVVSVTYRRIGA